MIQLKRLIDENAIMAFTIPKWVAHNVPSWNELLIDRGNGHTEINEATAAVINYMPVVGIPFLTSENAADAWRRIAIHQALFGSHVIDRQTGRPYFLTRSDVLRHIGLETEGVEQSFADFCASLPTRHQEESEL